MSMVSVTGIGAATALTGEAQPIAVSTGEQVEEGTTRTPVAGVVPPVVSSMSQAEEARSEPPSMQVAMSMVGRMEEGAPKASFMDVVMGQASVFASPAPSITRGAALEEPPPPERSALGHPGL